jgi:cytochrome c oxidase subunit II
MFTNFPFFPEQASAQAAQVDGIYFFMLAVTAFFSLLIAGLVVLFAIKYRRRHKDEVGADIHGSLALELLWTIIPFMITMVMFVWGVKIFFNIYRPPAGAMEVYVVGKQWMWKLQHPGGQREVNELHIPVDRAVRLTLISEDVIHSFFVPAFRTKVDVLPGRYVSTWFLPDRVGTYHLFCAEFCGTGHAQMVGKVHVMEKSAYADWLNERAEGSMALEGRKLFLKLQCVTCHSADARAPAPVLEGLFGRRVPLAGGGFADVDENYLRESILVPRAKVVMGFEPIMPSYKGQVGEEELIRLIAYLKSLRPGETPARTEEAPPPAAPPEEKGPPKKP